MNTDFRVSVDFFAHHKARKLRRRLGADALLSLLQLWAYAAKMRADGSLAGMDAEDVELAAGWDGDAGLFTKALVEVGFIDLCDDGMALHDWAENNPWVADEKSRKERAQKGAAARWAKQPECSSNAKAMLKHELSNAPLPSPSPEEKNKGRTPPTPPLGGGRGEEAAADPAEQIVEADIELEQFFDAYPARACQTIHACIPAWRAMKKAKAYPGLSKLFDSLCEWEASDQWQRDGGRYIPTPQKFLADRLWLAAPARAAPQQRQPDRGVPKHVQDRNAIARAYLRSEGVDPDACTAELYAAAYGDNQPTGGGAEPQGSCRADGDQGSAGQVRDSIPCGQDGGRGDPRHGENMGRRPRAFPPGDDRGGREAAPAGVEVLADHR